MFLDFIDDDLNRLETTVKIITAISNHHNLKCNVRITFPDLKV